MEEARRQSLVDVQTLKQADGRMSGPYGQRWADVTSDWSIVPGAEFDVELDHNHDIRVQVVAVSRQRPRVPGAYITVVPEIFARVIPS
jgi:hypothetical protein